MMHLNYSNVENAFTFNFVKLYTKIDGELCPANFKMEEQEGLANLRCELPLRKHQKCFNGEESTEVQPFMRERHLSDCQCDRNTAMQMGSIVYSLKQLNGFNLTHPTEQEKAQKVLMAAIEDLQCSVCLYKMSVVRHVIVILYELGRPKHCMEELYKLILGSNNSVKRMKKEDIVALCFFISLVRSMPNKINLPLQNKIASILTEFTIEEVAVVCLGFFKAQQYFYHKLTLRDEVILRLADSASTVCSVTLGAILKQITLSSTRITRTISGRSSHAISILFRELNILPIHRFNTSTLAHLLWYAYRIGYANDGILYAISTFLESNRTALNQVRLKDLAKMILVFSQFQHRLHDVCFYTLLSDEIGRKSREEELRKFPGSLITAVLGLSVAHTFPKNLLHLVYQECFNIKREFARDLYQIALTVSIEHPLLAGSTFREILQDNHLRDLAINVHSKYTKVVDIIPLVTSCLDEIMPSSCYLKHCILPHFRVVDFEVCRDAHLKYLGTSEWQTCVVDSIATMALKDKCHQKSVTRIAIILNTNNSYLMEENLLGEKCLQLRGQQQSKLIQLSCLGYHVIQVMTEYCTFRHVLLPYLREKLHNVQVPTIDSQCA